MKLRLDHGGNGEDPKPSTLDTVQRTHILTQALKTKYINIHEILGRVSDMHVLVNVCYCCYAFLHYLEPASCVFVLTDRNVLLNL